MKKLALATLLALAAALPARSEDTGNDVIIVYNTQLPDSKRVADHYAERRQVPTNHIFGFALGTGEEISRAEFQDSLQKPLAEALDARQLWRIRSEILPATNGQPAHVQWKVQESKIRYAVLCYGVPVRIASDTGLQEKGADSLRPELRRNEAAVDSELAVLPMIEQKLPITGPLNNPLYTITNAALIHPTNGVLMVTRLDGPSADIACGLVDKAIEAERNGLWGRAYFDLRATSDPNLKQGDEWISKAAEISRQLGFETVVNEKAATFAPEFPMSDIALYCGWYVPTADGPFTRPKVEFRPGAFAYHLHSYSAANLRSTTNNWVGPLLTKGATISMGCVTEPYIGATPDVSVFVARLLFHGFSFGEAAYACQNVLSWQTTSVGDPLYRPLARPAHELHAQLEAENSDLIDWSYLRSLNMNAARGVPMIQLSRQLDRLEATKASAVLTEKLADLYAGLGKPSSALLTYEKALTLDPSPQQRVRLRLALVEKLTEMDRKDEAYENLWTLLAENPDYPARFGVLRQLLDMAIKSNKPDEIIRATTAMSQYGAEHGSQE